VQQVVEEALARVLGGEQVRVQASGRTDAGVHARQQVVAFRCESERSARGILGGLNHHLPADVACLAARPAPEGFDPRRWTRVKTYRYRILSRRARCAFRAGFTWHLAQKLDLGRLQAEAAALVGRHDFRSFQAQGCAALHPVRTLAAVRITAREDELRLEFDGHGFLRHQVRIMVGSLVQVGLGRRPLGWIAEVLAAQDRRRSGPTAPAEGLWLWAVDCPDHPRSAAEPAPEDPDAELLPD